MIRATDGAAMAARLRARGAALSLAAWCALVPSAAVAQSAPAEGRDGARAMYEEGLRHAERAEWAEAYAKFTRAQELYPAPSNLFNIGQCQRALGRYVGALATFELYLVAAAATEDAEARKAAEAYITELRSRVARLRIRATPADANIAVDGKPAGGELVLDPGRHTVRVDRAGFTASFVDRDLRPGESATIEVRLQRLPAALSVKASVAGATVLIDGVPVGKVPWEGERAAGTHRVQIRAPGYQTYESQLRVAAGGRGELDAKLVVETVSIASRWWFWALVGGAVAGAAVTTYAVTRDTPPADYDGGSLGWVVRR